MSTFDTLPEITELRFGQDNDPVVQAGPFYSVVGDGEDAVATLIPRAAKRLRIVIKATHETDDVDALVDKNSEDHPLVVFGASPTDDGIWTIDLSDLLPPPGEYVFHMALSLDTSATTGRKTVGRGPVFVTAL